jgi:hypothetical protein
MLRDFGFVTVIDLTVALAGVMLVLPAVLLLAEREQPLGAARALRALRAPGPLRPPGGRRPRPRSPGGATSAATMAIRPPGPGRPARRGRRRRCP